MIIDVHINYPPIVSSPQPPPPQPPTPGCGIGAPPRTSTPRRLITPLGLQSLASAATLPSRPMPWTPGSRGAEAEWPGFEVPFLGFEGWYIYDIQWHPSCMYDLCIYDIYVWFMIVNWMGTRWQLRYTMRCWGKQKNKHDKIVKHGKSIREFNQEKHKLKGY